METGMADAQTLPYFGDGIDACYFPGSEFPTVKNLEENLPVPGEIFHTRQ
jgi:hypothetical protein